MIGLLNCIYVKIIINIQGHGFDAYLLSLIDHVSGEGKKGDL